MNDGSAEVVVVGGGVVGLACGAALARDGRSVVLLERNGSVGLETSSRNSQVVHGGLYYPSDSLKTQFCVTGRRLLYERCQKYGIEYRKVGKLIIATDVVEMEVLERLHRQALANQVEGISLRDGADVTRLEPRVRAIAALWSPETGIVDAEALVRSYLAEFESAGGTVALRTRVVGLERRAGNWRVETTGGDDTRYDIAAPVVINAAGLFSDQIAGLAGIDIDACRWRLHFCKGDYFSIAASLGRLTNHLVYPVPQGGGLGVHVTMDLSGRYRLGPDAEYVEEPALVIDSAKGTSFALAARRYLPEIESRHLEPEMSGIRPKRSGPGEPFADFVVEESSSRGAEGMINLIGIESPGLTAAGAIAKHVVALVRQALVA